MKYMTVEIMTNTQEKQTNSQKILKFLQENIREISNEELSEKIGINKSNIPREIKKLEKEGYNISKRYEQIGRSKYVWFHLTNTQEKQTNSQKKNSKKNVLTPKGPELKPKSSKEKPKNIDNKPLSQNSINTNINFVKLLGEEMRQFNRTISLDMKQELINWLFKNIDQLYEGIYYYLNAWEKRYNKRLIGAPSSPVIPKYEKMQKTFTKIQELIQFKQNLENVKKKEQNQLEEVLKNTKIRK